MQNSPSHLPPSTLSRRQVLALGASVAGGFAGAAIAGCAMPGSGLSVSTKETAPDGIAYPASFPTDVAHDIEAIIDAKGSVTSGVLQIGIDRDDIPGVTIHGTPIFPSFEINGQLNFQSMGGNRVGMNSDLCVKRDEVDPFISRLLASGIVFQAFHQHFYDFRPIVFFIHFRAEGDAEEIARGIKAALNVTQTPFPQAPPKNPKTPLPADELGKIIGATPTVSAKGVVDFEVPRADRIMLGNFRANPYLNIYTPVSFEPLDDSGKRAAAVPDYGMIASEIQHVIGHARGHGWDIGCLYNQETDEHPQLYFSHQIKVGHPIELAHEIRAALDMMNMRFTA